MKQSYDHNISAQVGGRERRPYVADEEAEVLKAIDEHWEELNKLIDQVFAGKKIQIKRIK